MRHGHTRGGKPTRIYKTWVSMRERCRNPNHSSYTNYGGRGIAVCDRWLRFEDFAADMGDPPTAKHTIERINNDGNYEPSNCKWATRTEQRHNRRPIRPFGPVQVGAKFGDLTVEELLNDHKARVHCSCGTMKVVARNHLAEGHTRSCGCLRIKTLLGLAEKERRHDRHDEG